MSGPLSNKEVADATEGLMNWFQSQDLDPPNALIVMAHLTAFLCWIHHREGTDAKHGAELVHQLVLRTIKTHSNT